MGLTPGPVCGEGCIRGWYSLRKYQLKNHCHRNVTKHPGHMILVLRQRSKRLFLCQLCEHNKHFCVNRQNTTKLLCQRTKHHHGFCVVGHKLTPCFVSTVFNMKHVCVHNGRPLTQTKFQFYIEACWNPSHVHTGLCP